jgi:hypothetical protein
VSRTLSVKHFDARDCDEQKREGRKERKKEEEREEETRIVLLLLLLHVPYSLLCLCLAENVADECSAGRMQDGM